MTTTDASRIPDERSLLLLMRRAHDLAEAAEATETLAARGLVGAPGVGDALDLLVLLERVEGQLREACRAASSVARALGATWADVGEATGRTRTAAHMRYGA